MTLNQSLYVKLCLVAFFFGDAAFGRVYETLDAVIVEGN